MQKHQWRERDEEGVRIFRAEYHSSTWRLISQWKGEEDWIEHDPISREEWKKLREILFNKYQRKRCPWEMVGRIDKLLEESADD